MHLTLKIGAGLYGEALVRDVGGDLGALSETDGLGLHPTADGAKNPHPLGHSGAVNLPLFARQISYALLIAKGSGCLTAPR